MEIRSKANKITAIVFISTSLFLNVLLYFFILIYPTKSGFLLAQISFIAGMFVLPIEALIWFACWKKSNKLIKLKTIIILNIICLFLLLLNLVTYFGFLNSTHWSGYSTIKKYELNGGCYIELNDKTIGISHDKFNTLTENNTYHFQYLINGFTGKPVLIYISEEQ